MTRIVAPMKIRPADLEGIGVTPAQHLELSRHMSNWIRAHRFLMNLHPQDWETVGRMLLVELNGPKRLTMVDRLASKFNRMRSIAFHNQITDALK